MLPYQRYFLELAYNGTHYHGWQLQPNAVTVQQRLNEALAILLRQPVETIGAGRTDTGVHARQLYVHFDAPQPPEGGAEVGGMMPFDWQRSSFRGLAGLLPYDIAVKRIIPVHADAHARFDATQRSYEYHMHFQKDPFKHDLSWLVKGEPDVEAMNKAAAIMMEYTDFSCFSKSNTQVFTNNCKLVRAEWVRKDDGLVFHISADRFLRNMVRAIVGTCMMVGRHEITPEAIHQIIQSKDRSNAGTSVPACGLYLTEVKYPYI
ncbi:tRNA pseudouridine(38-40) synthase TruA [Mucilaginibacter daejeonensis]|uniref:tRNA pseudouridine(38-40) synthase TruA n=1 Tax=Mucilaginibacter daejeonensis TaxID=398049 RepID=UPI001D170A77|nr:tRNA pseudouridine(38-40) synthase TruA [Mucilaginibacter daejeonensis]UEG53921.1 tRNA pseudouridine(38-40) synthase TruA [Mucilaginibacter daejeonensis]